VSGRGEDSVNVRSDLAEADRNAGGGRQIGLVVVVLVDEVAAGLEVQGKDAVAQPGHGVDAAGVDLGIAIPVVGPDAASGAVVGPAPGMDAELGDGRSFAVGDPAGDLAGAGQGRVDVRARLALADGHVVRCVHVRLVVPELGKEHLGRAAIEEAHAVGPRG